MSDRQLAFLAKTWLAFSVLTAGFVVVVSLSGMVAYFMKTFLHIAPRFLFGFFE